MRLGTEVSPTGGRHPAAEAPGEGCEPAAGRGQPGLASKAALRPVGCSPDADAVWWIRVPNFKIKLGSKTMALPEGEHDVGRMSDCWLTLDDELASRYHARFHVKDGRAEIEDLGSRNGTYVNGERIEGRRFIKDGDRIRIGRELLAVLGSEGSGPEEDDSLRRTLAPGEDTRFPSLIGQLVEKSLKVGKLKDAERYAVALVNQIGATKIAPDHPAAESCTRCLLQLAERSAGAVWIDKLFKLYADQGWIMSDTVLDSVRSALDRIPRVPGSGIKDYECRLRAMARDGVPVPPGLTATIAEIADAYGGG